MARNDGAVARQLDFGDQDARAVPLAQRAKTRLSAGARSAKAGLRLAVPSAVLRGPDKYTVLEHRRRQAQIKARKAVEAAATLDFEC